MTKKEDTEFDQWRQEVSAKLSDKAKEAFSQLLEDEAGAKEVFHGYQREGDYYRRLNSLAEERKSFESDIAQYASEKDALMNWYKTEAPKNQQLLSEKQKLIARLGAAKQQLIEMGLVEEAEILGEVPGATSTPHVSPNNELTSREFEQMRNRLDLFDKALPKLLASYGRVIQETAKGDWDVTPDAIMAHAIQNSVDPETAFYDLTAKERESRAAKDLEEKLAKAREEGRREAQTKQASPDHFSPKGPSIVDVLKKGESPADSRSRVNAAVQSYLEAASAGQTS